MLRYLVMVAAYSEAAARALHCWFSVDRVARDAETTAWKRLARPRQVQWRDVRGYPIGAHPHAGGDHSKPVGSRLALKFAMETGANFVSFLAIGVDGDPGSGLTWSSRAH